MVFGELPTKQVTLSCPRGNSEMSARRKHSDQGLADYHIAIPYCHLMATTTTTTVTTTASYLHPIS